MKKIILTAQDFAYGPIGKLLDLVSHFDMNKYEFTFIGFGTSIQLANKHGFNSIFEIDTEVKENEQKLRELIKNADLLISSMDIPSLKIAQEVGVKNIWLDCLFWFWDEIPEIPRNADLFIAELSLNNKRNHQKYSESIKNLLLVSTILPKIPPKKVINQALVSFGGAESTHWYQIGKETQFPYIMSEIITQRVEWGNLEKVYIATNERVIPQLREKYGNEKFIFDCLKHDEFIEKLSNSEVVLITPGLVTTQTAFYTKTPVIFLPSSNNSQYIQLEEYRKEGLVEASVALADFIERLDFTDKNESETNQMVIEQVNSIKENNAVKEKIGQKLSQLIETRRNWSKRAITAGERYLQSRGSNGSIKAVEAIQKLLV